LLALGADAENAKNAEFQVGIRYDNFPKPIKAGSASFWIESEVLDWAVQVEGQRRVA